ncbi:MAG: TerB family tellurite resistance protein [Mariprofundaceae bacterium]
MLKTLERWWKEEEKIHSDKPELTLALTKLMVGMMAMDGVMHENQKAEIIKQLGERFDLSHEESEELMQQASESDHRFEVLVQQLNESFNVEERTTILQELWQVAIANGEVDFREDRFINRLSGLLGVSADCISKTKASGANLKHTQPVFTE